MTIMTIKNIYPIEKFENGFYQLIDKIKIKKKKPLIIIHGGYGKRNMGDDAILIVINEKTQRRFPDIRIVAFSHFPDEVERCYGIESCFYASLKAFRLLLTADMLVNGGGGIVNKINTYSGFEKFKIFDPKGKFLFIAALFLKLRRKPVVFYAVSTTSIPDFIVKSLMRITFPLVDMISVRDPISQKLLKKIGIKREIPICHDPAIDLIPASDDRAIEILKLEGIALDKIKLGLNIRYVSDEKSNIIFLDKYREFIDIITKKYADIEIVFISTSLHQTKKVENDYELALELKSKLSEESKKRFKIVKNLYSPSEIKAILKHMNILFLSRHHAVIFSQSYKIPICIVSYDEKVEIFGKMMGWDENIIRLQDLTVHKLLNKFDSFYQKLKCN